MDQITTFLPWLYTTDNIFQPRDPITDAWQWALVEEIANSCLDTKHGATGAEFGLCIHHANPHVLLITDQTQT